MKSFSEIAIPHKDIQEGNLTMEIFAANLWEVYNGRGPDEYKDAAKFFSKTYMTHGLEEIINAVRKRVEGKGGDAVIQLTTPFGGGKTHTLIALYHKAKEWNVRTVVVVGTSLNAKEDTLWGLIEKQLENKEEPEILSGNIAPGMDKLREVLSKHTPLLILMDEVLEYVTKAAGVAVGKSTLAEQTIAFMQELTETVCTLGNACLVLTMPTSITEHYDSSAEKFYSKLQKISGRVEKISTPVADSEIAKVVRTRLFSSVDEDEARDVVEKFVKYASEKEILPQGVEPAEYRDRFLESYPFLPEVIDVLYHRWGSFPKFQRTRGVLRILALVISSLQKEKIPYISLADFDLSNPDIRAEFIKYVGEEYNSVLSQDITGKNAGAKVCDNALGQTYKKLRFATRAATTIFLYSFSTSPENGAKIEEITRQALIIDYPLKVITEAVEKLQNELFYIQRQNERIRFSNIPNINKILINRMENISKDEILEKEKKCLERIVKSGEKGNFRIYIGETDTNNIPDNEDFKLVILMEENKNVVDSIIRNKGTSHRINSNTVFFLLPSETENVNLEQKIREYLAYVSIINDKNLSLSDEQKEEARRKTKELESDILDLTRRTYRIVALPQKNNHKILDLGVPTYGEKRDLGAIIYETLVQENEILVSIDPLAIKEKFLKDKKYVHTEQILHASYRTPGEPRLRSREVLIKSIQAGVEKGIFGLGFYENNEPRCTDFKKSGISVRFTSDEILIASEESKDKISEMAEITEVSAKPDFQKTQSMPAKSLHEKHYTMQQTQAEDTKTLKHLSLRVELDSSQTLPDLLNVLRFILSKFKKAEITLKATDGSMTPQEYEQKIKEALDQIGINYEEM
ncbi:MAG: DUF499 domain-containing protein [Thermoplasmata archaeon]